MEKLTKEQEKKKVILENINFFLISLLGINIVFKVMEISMIDIPDYWIYFKVIGGIVFSISLTIIIHIASLNKTAQEIK